MRAEIGKNPPYGVDCVHNSCGVAIVGADPETQGGVAAKVYFIFNGDRSNANLVLATSRPYSVAKNMGGPKTCVCKKTEGGNTGGSAPQGSSGDSSLDAGSTGPNASFEADPINTATGNKFQQETDFRGSEWLTFRRFYNSFNLTQGSALGPNWRHTFSRTLEVMTFDGHTHPDRLNLFQPDGSSDTFKYLSGAWVADADNPDTIVEQDDSSGNPTGYLLHVASNHHTEAYTAQGQLQSIVDTTGRGVTLTYSDETTPTNVAPKPGLLLSVKDTQGRQLDFSYTSDGGLDMLVLPDGKTITYGYDTASKNVNLVEYPDGKSRQYLYNEPSLTSGGHIPTALTGVIDEAGKRFETTAYSYYSQGKAVSTGFAGGADQVSISYDYGTTATITTPLGAAVTLHYANSVGVYKPSSTSASCGTQCNESLKATVYDANGYPTQTTDFKNVVTKTTYDVSGLLQQEIDAYGTPRQRTINTTWDAALRQPLTRTILDADGNSVATTAWAYNTAGQTTAQCDIDPNEPAAATYVCSATGAAPAGVRRTTWSYCAAVDSTQCPMAGLLLTEDGPRTDVSDVTQYGYYLDDTASHKHGDLKSVTDALGQTTSYLTYDGDGRLLTKQDVNGVVATLSYTPRGWLASRNVGGATTTLTYTDYGAVHTVTDPDGVAITYDYDDAHRLTQITDAQGNYIHYTLDPSGNRTKEETFLADGTLTRSLSRTFNKLGQLTTLKDGLGHTVFDASGSGSYDAVGNLLQASDGLGVKQKNTFDELSRLVSAVADYNGASPSTQNSTTNKTYDALDRITQVQDPNGLATTFGYDGLGNLTQEQSPDTGTTHQQFDAAGNLTSSTDAKGVLSTRSYDALNRLTHVSYPTATNDVSYAFDEANSVTGCTHSYPVGRLTRLIENEVTTVYCYDARGNVTQKTQVQGTHSDVTSYSFTPGDRLSQLTYPSGAEASYGYDANGRIDHIDVTAPSAATTSAVHDVVYRPFGPVASYTLGNGQAVARSYDANYALTDLVSPNLALHFARDVMGNVTALGDAPGASPAKESYHYDSLYRLTSSSDASGVTEESYGYNKTGDRLSKTGNGFATGTYAYDSGTHHLASIGNAARGYDANGNTTASVSGGESFAFVYNELNRLSSAQRNGSTVGTYVFNALGERVSKTATLPQAVDERYVYSGSSTLLSELGTTGRDYVWLDGLPVALVDHQAGTATLHFVQADGLGTPRSVADTNGTEVWHWPYQGNAFGEEQPSSSGYTLNLRFPGQYYDAESGVSYNVNRDYDATIGRYIQSDPIGLTAGISTYAYAADTPLNLKDPLGLATCHLVFSEGKGALSCVPDDPTHSSVDIPVASGNNGGGENCKNNPICSEETGRGPIPSGCWQWTQGYTSKPNGRVLNECDGWPKSSRTNIRSHSCKNAFGPSTHGPFCSEGCVTGSRHDIQKLNRLLDAEPGSILIVGQPLMPPSFDSALPSR